MTERTSGMVISDRDRTRSLRLLQSVQEKADWIFGEQEPLKLGITGPYDVR